MTVSTLNNRVPAAGNGVTTVFPFGNKFLLDEDLVVLEVNDATGVETPKTLNTHYTVTGAGGDDGGAVTMLTAPASGVTLVIYRDPALTQPIDLVNGDDLDVDTGIERGLDRSTLQIQRLRDLVDRSMRLSDGDTSGATVQLPIPAANNLLGWNATGMAIENKVPVDVSLTTVSAFAATLLDDSTAADARTTLGAASTAELNNFITDQSTLTAPAVGDTLVVHDLSATANREITLSDTLKVINGLTEDTSPDKTADYVLIYSTSGAAARKVKLETIIRQEAVRQTVVAGGVDANGQANFLNAGTGLAVDMDAATTPVVATFAAGEDALGPINYRTRFAADQSDYWASLPANNLSYLLFDRDTGTGVISAYKTIVPIQYSPFFDKTLQALLPFSGADASTTITDTYGNTWAAIGNAQIDTSVTIDSQQTLLTDGTGDGITSTAITALSPGGWTIEGKVTFAALPASTAKVTLAHYVNGSGFGFEVYLYNNAGTYQLEISASSNGTSNNIASAVRVNLPSAPTLGTAYHWAATWDKVAGKLYTYWGGVKVNDTAMTTGICAITKASHCSTDAGANSVNGSTAGIRLSPCCRYSAGTTFTPPTLPFSADAEWFDLSEFKWKYGSPTSWAEKQRVAVGEVTTNATVPTSIITYALRGRYASPAATPWPALSTLTSVNHYIGVQPIFTNIRVTNIVSELGYAVGDQMIPLTSGAAGEPTPVGLTSYVNTVSFTTGNNTTLALPHKTTGANLAATTTSWSYKLTAARGW